MSYPDENLDRVCLDLVREIFGYPPLYQKDEPVENTKTIKPSRKDPWKMMKLSVLASRIREHDSAAVVELRNAKRGCVLQVFINGQRVLYHDTKKRPIRELLPAIESRWGRVWE